MDELSKKIEKVSFSISEVSEITEIKDYVLRFWENEFEQLKPQKNISGNRRYTKDEIALVFKIKSLLYEQKLTIKGAKQALENEDIRTAQNFHWLSDLDKIKTRIEKLIQKLDS